MSKAPPCECPLAGFCQRHKMQKSKRMHQLCQTVNRYRAMWDRTAQGLPVEEPGLVRKVVTVTDSMARWHAAGKPTRPPEEVARIFDDECRACEHYEGDAEGGHCRMCGCQLRRAGGLLNKIAMATEECPLGKWGSDDAP